MLNSLWNILFHNLFFLINEYLFLFSLYRKIADIIQVCLEFCENRRKKKAQQLLVTKNDFLFDKFYESVQIE